MGGFFIGAKKMTKEEILQAIKDTAEKLGRAPSLIELRAATGVTARSVRKNFVNYTEALRLCGLERGGAGFTTPMDALFKDWAELTRKLGRVPKIVEYDLYGKYSSKPLLTRYQTWGQVPAGLLLLAEEKGWEGGWEDVLEVVRLHLQKAGKAVKRSRTPNHPPSRPKILRDRPTYGPPVSKVPLAHGPMNESGVMFLFGVLAASLGFLVTRIQIEFPDCEAMREVEPDVWQRVRIEMEYESRNFVRHLHDPHGCDLIVCWVDTWPESPLEVIELKSALERLQPGVKIESLPQMSGDP
jgi:hypothetical protein